MLLNTTGQFLSQIVTDHPVVAMRMTSTNENIRALRSHDDDERSHEKNREAKAQLFSCAVDTQGIASTTKECCCKKVKAEGKCDKAAK